MAAVSERRGCGCGGATVPVLVPAGALERGALVLVPDGCRWLVAVPPELDAAAALALVAALAGVAVAGGCR